MITRNELEYILYYRFGIDPDTVPEDDMNFILEHAQDEYDYYGNSRSIQSILENAIVYVLLDD